MRNKWIKRLFPLFALLLLAPWPVASVYASSNYVTNQEPVHREVAEGLEATNTVAVNTIIAQEEVLPSHVYVLNNREIVTQETLMEINNSPDTDIELTYHSQTASASGTIIASVTVTPSRQIVVDENDRVIEIWSNTTGMKRNFYSLRVKELSLQGHEHPLTQEILAQYNRLLGQVDWTETGKVYKITTAKQAK